MTLFQSDTDVSINVYRRRENITYDKFYDSDHAAIAYFSKDSSFLASNNISIIDRSSSLVSNRTESSGESFVFEGIISQTFDTSRLLVSDQFATTTNGVMVPLFLQHIINTENVARVSVSDYTLDSNVSLVEVKILNKDFEEVSILESSIDYTKGIIYNNLSNDIESDIYYIKYTVKSSGVISTYTEILNNSNVYTEATFDDLDDDLEIIDDGRKVYLVNKVYDKFQIILPHSGDYGFYIIPRAKINILSFNDLDSRYKWFPRISNGDFFIERAGQKYRYYIAQFNTQSWNPSNPYKNIEEISKYVSSNLIALNRDKVYEDSDKYIDVLVNDKDDNGLIAFTTNPSLHATAASNKAIYYYYSFSSKIGIRSIDYLNGILDVEGYDLEDTYKIYSTYYFEEEDFEFNSIDLNPINNTDILNKRFVFFIIPETGDVERSKTLYYLVIDKRNRVIESDWSDFDNDSQLLNDGNELYYRGVPSFITPTSGYSIFVDDYTVEGDGTYLTIGDLLVDAHFDIDELDVKDLRIFGGGIAKDRIVEAKLENPEVIWYWDIGKWDGEFYPGNASYYVEVPVTVLSGAGGTFTQKQVRNVIEKHTALGVYPIVKTYGVDPYITTTKPYSDSIYIEWYSFGSDKYYNVYYSQKVNGPWTKANASLLSDDNTGNTCTITGLSSGVYYHIMIIGGELENGVFVPYCGQSVAPVEDGAKSLYNLNIARIKTR